MTHISRISRTEEYDDDELVRVTIILYGNAIAGPDLLRSMADQGFGIKYAGSLGPQQDGLKIEFRKIEQGEQHG